jgi:hypothetical protein
LLDGLYCIETPTIGAAFVVRGGRVAYGECAPILWRRIEYWSTRAHRIGDVKPIAMSFSWQDDRL